MSLPTIQAQSEIFASLRENSAEFLEHVLRNRDESSDAGPLARAIIDKVATTSFVKALIFLSGNKWGPIEEALLLNNEGRSNSEIAAELGISRAMVSKKEIALLRKFGRSPRVPDNKRKGGWNTRRKNRGAASAPNGGSVKSIADAVRDDGFVLVGSPGEPAGFRSLVSAGEIQIFSPTPGKKEKKTFGWFARDKRISKYDEPARERTVTIGTIGAVRQVRAGLYEVLMRSEGVDAAA